jgi:diguanylate cyclase (GGDEF)-like protein/PAS domain S-box-containing protein
MRSMGRGTPWTGVPAAGSIRTRRLAPVVCLYVVVVLATAVLVQRSAAGERAALQQRQDTRIVTTARFIGSYVADLQDRQATLAARRLAGPIDGGDFVRLSMDQGFHAAVVLDEAGSVLAAAHEGPDGPAALRADRFDYLRTAVETGDRTVSRVAPAESPGHAPVVSLAVPFTAADGRRRVFSGAYTVTETPLRAYLANFSPLAGHETYLIDTAGAVVATGGDAAGERLSVGNAPLDAALAKAPAGTVNEGQRQSYYTSAAVPGTPWRIVFAAPTESVFAPLGGVMAWVPWLILGAFAATGLMALVAAGRYRTQSGRLARSEARSEAFLRSTPEAYIGVDEQGVITDWNPAATALLGWPAADALGRRATEVYIPAAYHGLFHQYLTGELPLPTTPVEYTARHIDGHEIPVELMIGRVPWLSGSRYHAFLRDLRPRLTAERELRRLAAIVAATGDAVMSTTSDGTVTSWNPASEQLYGYTAEEIIGGDFTCLIPPDRIDEAVDVISQVDAGRAVGPFETVHVHKDGHGVQVSVSVSPLFDAEGAVVGACAVARDITHTRRQAAELQEAEERFRLAFDAVPVGMALTSLADADRGRLIRVNGGFCWMLGYTEEELRSRTLADITHPDDVAAERELLAPFHEGRQRTLRLEKRFIRSDGSTVWAMVSSAVVDGADGRPRYAVTQVEDITARRAEQERLTALALCDPLTGLANRMLFEDRLTQAAHRAGRHDRTVAVVYCDLDHFKPVNDEFGHSVGDELLRQVGHRLLVAMRPSDTVARLGGDEFAVICEDLADADAALPISDRVRAAVEGTYLVSAGAVRIGCSVGVATAAGTGIESRDLVRRADLSMFTDKRSRRDQPEEPDPDGARPGVMRTL